MDRSELEKRARDYVKDEADAGFRGEVEALLAGGDAAELEDRFYQDLEFGTGGLRGLIGGGTNRMNSLVVGKATQGLATYLKKAVAGKQLSAVIAYDSRRYSDRFALDCALVFAANGIKAWLFESLRPTPELSFAVRELGADTGLVITASHNPPAYNGYKAYWADGAQVIPPHDEGIIAEVLKVRAVARMDEAEALEKGLLVRIGEEIDGKYVAMVKAQLFRPELIKQKGSEAKIVYTPLHGTGGMPFMRVMGELGLPVVPVQEQFVPDGNFPTVSYPNPEEAAALKLALELGVKEKADVVMATDPDADRLGIAVPAKDGSFTLVTGNQLGALLLDYILLSRKELGRMPKKPATIKSIVTTELQRRVASAYGCECHDCLTGFKWIAALMASYEKEGLDFVFGTEESYGYLVEREVRDKDGISAAAMTAEAALYWRTKGKSLLDRLEDLWKEHGYYEELGISKHFQGSNGMETMKGIMTGYRDKQPAALGGIKVVRVADVKTGEAWDTAGGRKEKLGLPSSNVIQWTLADGTVVTVRPSGTEPKIKFYASCRGDSAGGLEKAKYEVKAKLAAIEKDIRAVVG